MNLPTTKTLLVVQKKNMSKHKLNAKVNTMNTTNTNKYKQIQTNTKIQKKKAGIRLFLNGW